MGILLFTLIFLLVSTLGTFFISQETFPKLLNFITGRLLPAILTLSLYPILKTLLSGEEFFWQYPWALFQNSLSLHLDALSAFFLLPIVLLSILACLFGKSYLAKHAHGLHLGRIWSTTFLLIFSMISVVLANNSIFFLVVWELMSLSSFFLVIYQAHEESSRKAGWLYLSLTQIGTVFIIANFFLLAKETGSFDFAQMALATKSSQLSTLAFFLALIGFGTKAGMMPLHIWLPEAHPKAPSHVSALMSGVMIKTGIYGILRTLTLVGPVQNSWAITLMVIGALTGIISVIFAITQKDIKRLLAYCSVKNIGIILIGMSLGLWGLNLNNPLLTLMGFSAALLHILNHALFKGLLFLSAGSVISSTHTQDMEEMGGLGKFMPITSANFLFGSIAICGLPPLNGFISEFFIYLGSFQALSPARSWNNLPFILTILSLALIGGLAVICFSKAYGIIFLGAPRKKLEVTPHENNWEMTLPQSFLSLLCLLIGLFPFYAFALLKSPLQVLCKNRIELPSFESMNSTLNLMGLAALIFLAFLVALYFIRRHIIQKNPYEQTETWGCGYTQPTARIQYTGSSFVQMLSDHFDFILRGKRKLPQINDLFPGKTEFQSEFDDSVSDQVYKPVYHGLEKILRRLTGLQHGVLNVYVLYIVLTLVLLLAFQLD